MPQLTLPLEINDDRFATKSGNYTQKSGNYRCIYGRSLEVVHLPVPRASHVV